MSSELTSWHFRPFKALRLVVQFAKERRITWRDTVVLFVQFSYYSGILPIYHDSATDLFRLRTSKRGLLTYHVIFTLYSLAVMILAVGLSYDLVWRGIYIRTFMDVIPMFIAILIFFTWSLHVHTFVKMNEIAQTLNGFKIYAERKRIENHETQSGSDEIPLFVKMGVLNLILVDIQGPALYLYQCNAHFLAAALPVCSTQVLPDGSLTLTHQPLPYFILFTIVNFLLANILNSAVFPYIGIAITLVYDGAEAIKRLS